MLVAISIINISKTRQDGWLDVNHTVQIVRARGRSPWCEADGWTTEDGEVDRGRW